MHPVVQQIAQEYKGQLKKLYGDDLAELVLYGSFARGDQHAESDIDFAIVLHNLIHCPSAEIFKTAPIASNLSLKFGVMVSSLTVSFYKKQTSMQGLYRTIRQEGIAI